MIPNITIPFKDITVSINAHTLHFIVRYLWPNTEGEAPKRTPSNSDVDDSDGEIDDAGMLARKEFLQLHLFI